MCGYFLPWWSGFERAPHFARMASFLGYSGYGKTYSAIDARIKYRALYLECGQSWTRKAFLVNLCMKLGYHKGASLWIDWSGDWKHRAFNQKPS